MNVLCAYTDLRPQTRDALNEHASGTQFIDVSASPLSYWREVRSRWTGEEDLVLVEHDIVIHGDVLPQFAACDSLWCTFAYPWNKLGWTYKSGAGCAKYSAALQRLVPVAEIDECAGSCPETCEHCAPECREGVCWHHMDACFVLAFGRHDLHLCLHSPDVGHLHIREY